MITKEQIRELNDKWALLLDDLRCPAHVKYKFARVYEKIVASNHPKNTKLLLSVAHRVFAKMGNLKATKSSKNKVMVTAFSEDDLYDGYAINIEKAISFSEALADMTIEEITKAGRFSHLQAEGDKIYFIY